MVSPAKGQSELALSRLVFPCSLFGGTKKAPVVPATGASLFLSLASGLALASKTVPALVHHVPSLLTVYHVDSAEGTSLCPNVVHTRIRRRSCLGRSNL